MAAHPRRRGQSRSRPRRAGPSPRARRAASPHSRPPSPRFPWCCGTLHGGSGGCSVGVLSCAAAPQRRAVAAGSGRASSGGRRSLPPPRTCVAHGPHSQARRPGAANVTPGHTPKELPEVCVCGGGGWHGRGLSGQWKRRRRAAQAAAPQQAAPQQAAVCCHSPAPPSNATCLRRWTLAAVSQRGLGLGLAPQLPLHLRLELPRSAVGCLACGEAGGWQATAARAGGGRQVAAGEFARSRARAEPLRGTLLQS